MQRGGPAKSNSNNYTIICIHRLLPLLSKDLHIYKIRLRLMCIATSADREKVVLCAPRFRRPSVGSSLFSLSVHFEEQILKNTLLTLRPFGSLFFLDLVLIFFPVSANIFAICFGRRFFHCRGSLDAMRKLRRARRRTFGLYGKSFQLFISSRLVSRLD